MDSGKTQQMPNEEPNWQECKVYRETMRNIEASDCPELAAAIAQFEQGFARVEDVIQDRTPAGTAIPTFALGGRVREGENCKLVATDISAAIEQFKRDTYDRLLRETDGKKKGYVLYWRERPNFVVQTFKGAFFTYERWGLWWRCAVEPCEKTVSETESRS